MSDVLDIIESLIQPVTGQNAVPRTVPTPISPFAYALDVEVSDDDNDEPIATGRRQQAQWPPRTAESIAEDSSNGPSTIFDDHSEYRTASSAPPSRIGDQRHPPPVHSPPLHSHMHGVNTPERFLPCELFGFGCSVRFPLYQVSDWIRHLETEHLRDTIPRNSVCWFCDSPGNNRFRPASDSHEDCRAAFRRRMRHVAEHFRNGVPQAARPDWYLLEHLRDIGEIRPDLFSQITEHIEAPPGTLTINRTPPARRPPSFLQQDRGQYFRQAQSNYIPR